MGGWMGGWVCWWSSQLLIPQLWPSCRMGLSFGPSVAIILFSIDQTGEAMAIINSVGNGCDFKVVKLIFLYQINPTQTDINVQIHSTIQG